MHILNTEGINIGFGGANTAVEGVASQVKSESLVGADSITGQAPNPTHSSSISVASNPAAVAIVKGAVERQRTRMLAGAYLNKRELQTVRSLHYYHCV